MDRWELDMDRPTQARSVWTGACTRYLDTDANLRGTLQRLDAGIVLHEDCSARLTRLVHSGSVRNLDRQYSGILVTVISGSPEPVILGELVFEFSSV